MNFFRLSVKIILIGVILTAGFWLGRNSLTKPPAILKCRPSYPEIAAASAGKPVILFIGNSLIYDYDWRINGATTVNCSQQGLTAKRTVYRLDSLPQIKPAMIVLSLGSVEVAGAGQTNTPVNAESFETNMRMILEYLNGEWPDTRTILFGVPVVSASQQFAFPTSPEEANKLNNVLEKLSRYETGTSFEKITQSSNVTSSGFSSDMTYDGVHLTRFAYGHWELAIQKLFDETGSHADN